MKIKNIEIYLIIVCLVVTLLSAIPGSCATPVSTPVPPVTTKTSTLPTPPSTVPSLVSSPTLSTIPTPLQAIKFSDSTNDLFDKTGKAITGEPYLDIVEIELSSLDNYFIARIKLNGSLPTKIEDPLIFIEWDILVDMDNNPATGWNWPLIYNDIGPDFLFRLELRGDQYKGSVLDTNTRRWGSIGYKINGNIVELQLPKTVLQAISFNYVAATRKYGQSGDPNALLLADKTPNKGHLKFPDGYVLAPGSPITSLDTDKDGFPDDEEVSFWNTNPNTAERWDDLDTVTGILNTPKKVSVYLQHKFTAVTSPSTPFTVPVKTIFKEKSGDCDEYAILATFLLAKNGYEAYFVKIFFDREWRGYKNHDICMYREKDGYWYSIDIYFHGSGRNPVGPFKSINDYCQQVPSHYGNIGLGSYELYDYDGRYRRRK